MPSSPVAQSFLGERQIASYRRSDVAKVAKTFGERSETLGEFRYW